jgi:NhaP-type Na+/H+ or K+/H+ antiporter
VGGKVLLLAFIPATCEGVMITLVAPWLLGLSVLESAILASVLAAVSPAVVVPSMIRFIEERRGVDKDIPSMIMAAASVDDIYVVVVHSIVLGLYVGGQVNVGLQIASVPVSLVLGIVVGLGIGVLMYRLFDRFNPRATKRVLIILAVAILLVRLQHVLAGRVPFAGLISAMAIGFVILEKREHMAHEISAKLGKIWVFAAIILFSMVGAQVNVAVAWQEGAAAVGVLALGLLARSAGVLACLSRSELSVSERLFVAVAYSPKATVQAAIGGAPLAAMKLAGMDTGPGEIILAVAVLSIVLTAPAGAWGIATLGKRVLAVAPEAGGDAYQAALESKSDDEG